MKNSCALKPFLAIVSHASYLKMVRFRCGSQLPMYTLQFQAIRGGLSSGYNHVSSIGNLKTAAFLPSLKIFLHTGQLSLISPKIL
jgi:hypothetical protein